MFGFRFQELHSFTSLKSSHMQFHVKYAQGATRFKQLTRASRVILTQKKKAQARILLVSHTQIPGSTFFNRIQGYHFYLEYNMVF